MKQLNKYWFNFLACDDKAPPPPTHTCLSMLLSPTPEGLMVAGKGRRLHSARKSRLKPGRGVDGRTSWAQPDGGYAQGPAAFGKLGSYPEAAAICESLREKHILLGALAVVLSSTTVATAL